MEDTKRRLIQRLSGAAPSVVEDELLMTVQDFFRETMVWRQAETLTVNGDTANYEVGSSMESTPARMIEVKLNGRDLNPIGDHDDLVGVRNNSYRFDAFNREITIPKGSVGELRMFIAWVPEKLEDIPPGYVVEYRDGIMDGALARMLVHPNRPYSNPGQAIFHGRRYKTAISRAKRNILTRNAKADVGFRFPHATRSGSLR